jgi:general nucleoside transport system permease protein
MDPATIVTVLDSALRLAIPLLAACLAGLWSERAGIVDIGLEGKMLVAAFAAAAAAAATDSAWIGLAAGTGASVALALVHGFAAISQRGNQIVSGVAINMLAAGLTAIVGNAWYGQGGRTPPLEGPERFGGIVAGHSVLVWLALAAVPATWFVLANTRFGLRISVAGLRYVAVILAGILCGLAGTYLSVGQSAGFLPNMTAGKGFIALAALIFAKWRAWPALGACLLFGLLDAVAIRLQGIALPGIGEVPVQAIQALPYLMTVILLAGVIGTAIPPRASGIPYAKER